LWLILAAASIGVAAVIGASVAAIVVGAALGQLLFGVSVGLLVHATVVVSFVLLVLRLTRESDVPRWVVVVAATLFALPLLTVLLVVALAVSIVAAFAQRAIVIENIGPLAALRSGWQMARAHLGESLLTWLVNLGLALASGIVLLVVIFAALALLAPVGAALVGFAGFSTPTLLYASLAGLVFLAAVLTVAGISNAFFWSFWTLVYLRLRGGAAAPA
jgi:hypothetical protein